MSASGFRPQHVAHPKRPFEDCSGGYDSDPDPTMSGTPSSSSNKRARSTSSDDSNPSSSSGYNTAPSEIASDANPLDCIPPPPMSDLHIPIPPPQPQRTPPTPEDSLRTSLQRFAEFDRQIAALRTSLAGARSPPLPPFPPSVDGDPAPSNELWHPSNGASVTDPAPTVAVAPTETLSTRPDSHADLPAAPSIPRCPYRPSLAVHEPSAFVRPSNDDGATRSSAPVEPFGSAPDSHLRRAHRSLSPLVFPSTGEDDILLRYPHRGPLSRPEVHPPGPRVRVSAEREPVPSVFDVFNMGDSSSRPSAVREPVRFAESVPPRAPTGHNERARRPAPTTSITHANQALPQDLHLRHHPSRTSIPSSNSLMSESASERRHVLALERFHSRHHRSSFDADDEPDSPWSGSSRGEGRYDFAVPPSPADSMRGTGTGTLLGAMHAPPPPTTNRAETSYQRTLSDLLGETERAAREEGLDDLVLDWDIPARQRQRERAWVLDLERQDVRGRSFPSGSSLASTSSARDESSHPPVPAFQGPSRPPLGPPGAGQSTTTTTTNNGPQYSYSNLNLASFQSGLFRDSLRRNAEVDQASTTSIIPTFGDTRAPSRLGMEDSGSDMDLDDFVEHRLRYAGHTPPPDYAPPPRTTSPLPLPNFSVLRRNSLVHYEPQGRPLHSRPMPPVPPVPTTYERPAAPERAERTDRFLPARILESLYRSHEDGRRNAPAGARQAYHPAHQNHVPPSGPSVVPRGDATAGPRNAVGENRRTSLLGGSLRSRFARFANAQSSANTSDVSATSRQRLTPHPIGARPQDQRRMSVFGGAPVVEQESRPGAYGAQQQWDPSMVPREVPWRAASAPRNGFVPPPPASSAAPDGTGRGEEQRSRLRTLRQRLQLDRGEGMRVFRPGMLRGMGRRGNLGDYVPDELFDDSYEALLSLSNMLGDVRSRATPEEVIASLPTGTYKEWKRDDSESRCPICLDDYEPLDVLTKLVECTHWLHKNCLEQWLRTANTCPVCREKVKSSPKPAPARRRPFRDSSATNQGTSGSTPPSGRPPQANNGRPMSFSAIVFDRLMNEGRDESWGSTAPPQVPAPTQADIILERLRQPPPPRQYQHTHPYPPSMFPHRGSSSSSELASVRPLVMRDQGSDTSMSSGSSANMVVDGTGSGMLLDPPPPPMPRRESMFPFVPPPTGFGGGAPAAAAPPVEGHDWRASRYDALFSMDTSRSSSSSSSSSGVSVGLANRIPVDEDGAFEEFVLGWSIGRAT